MRNFGKKNKSTQATLQQYGKDIHQYLALHINKRDLPEGSELVVMVRDEATGEIRPITINDEQDAYAFAQNSRFFGQTMQDGHIFNPYIHRRFIAVQFERLIRQYGYSNVKRSFSETRGWDYAIDVLLKEVHVLATLQRKDTAAFNERSRFFTMSACLKIIYDYAYAVRQHIDKHHKDAGQYPSFYLPKYGMMKKQNARPMMHRFWKLVETAKDCKTYAQLEALLEGFDWLKLPTGHHLPDSFVTPYLEAGAYFTLKHHMMFKGLTMGRESQHESLRKLREYRFDCLDLYMRLVA